MAHFRHTDDYAAPPTVAQIERQVRWEVAAIEAGVKRYRKEFSSSENLATTSAGTRLIREVMPAFVEHLKETQEALQDQLTGSRGKPREWWTYFCLLSADKLAFIALNSALSQDQRTFLRGNLPAVKVTAFARNFVKHVEAQVAYEEWVAEDRTTAKEARSLGVVYRRQLDALKARTKKVDNRAFKRWMARLERAWKQPWPESERIAFGCAIARHLTNVCGRLFELISIPRPGGKTELYVQLTELARQIVEDHNARAEVARPPKRPMLCQPKTWVLVKGDQECNTMAASTSKELTCSAPA